MTEQQEMCDAFARIKRLLTDTARIDSHTISLVCAECDQALAKTTSQASPSHLSQGALKTLTDFVERSTHWREGGATRHDALIALRSIEATGPAQQGAQPRPNLVESDDPFSELLISQGQVKPVGQGSASWRDGTRPPFEPGPMNADRAAYFMRRFKHEEKLLGPNEQSACDFILSMLDAASQRNGSDEEPVNRNDPLSALAIRILVALEKVSQNDADHAFRLACEALEDEARRMNVELPWVVRAPCAAPPAILEQASYRVDDEAQLRSAVSVMDDVLTDIAGWEDQALAEAVRASRTDLLAMADSIKFLAPSQEQAQQPQAQDGRPYKWKSVDGKQHDTGRVTNARGSYIASTSCPEDARMIADALNAWPQAQELPAQQEIDRLRTQVWDFTEAAGIQLAEILRLTQELDGLKEQAEPAAQEAVSRLHLLSDIMRWADAYAADYKDHGKFASSRHHLERRLLALLDGMPESTQQPAPASAELRGELPDLPMPTHHNAVNGLGPVTAPNGKPSMATRDQ